jgi:hypothetical protein
MLAVSHDTAGSGLAPLPSGNRAAAAVTSGSAAISSLIRARIPAAPVVPAGTVMSGSPAAAAAVPPVMAGSPWSRRRGRGSCRARGR